MKLAQLTLVAGLLLAGPVVVRGQATLPSADHQPKADDRFKSIPEIARTDLQKKIAEIMTATPWPANYEALKRFLKDRPAGEQVDGLLPFIAVRQDTNGWNPHGNACATYLLGELGEPAAPALLKLLDHEDAAIREAAVAALSHMAFEAQLTWPKPGAMTVKKLAVLLTTDKSAEVRQEAANALCWYRAAAKPVADQISTALEDEDPSVRSNAMEALVETEIADDKALANMIKILQASGSERIDRIWKFGPAARSFLPLLLEEEPLTELQWALYVAFAEDAERQRDEAALGARIAAVTGQVNDAFAGMLPDGMRFEWVTDGG